MTQHRHSLEYNLNYDANFFVSVLRVRINMEDTELSKISF